MTIFYPDISGYQAGIDLKGAVAVCAKVTEGTAYTNPDYARAKAEAATHGVFFFAYHFLRQGNGAAQADWCYKKAGKTPLMLDFEPIETATIQSHPNLADALAFIERFRAIGGVVTLVYLPRWYWGRATKGLGSVSLKPLADRGLALVSSAYPAAGYSDAGIGWQPYGGMTPAIWQYTSNHAFNGQAVDFNAYKGTLGQLKALVLGAPPKPESLILRQGDSGPAVVYLQTRLNVWGAKLGIPDGIFGPATLAAVKAFQTRVFGPGPAVDGIVGPQTWAALDKAPPAPKPPAPYTYAPPTNLKVVAAGHTSVKLAWTPPKPVSGIPVPAGYKVWIYPVKSPMVWTPVRSYPRQVAATTYQFGSLQRGVRYVVHVSTAGPNGTHVRPGAYASAEFTTG